MAYTQQTWADDAAGGTPLSAARLNHIEDGVAGALEKLDATVVITDPTNQQIFTVTINDDGTATTGWPDRWEVFFQPTTGAARHTFYLNEYGEIRVAPAKNSTVPFRVFTRENPSDPLHLAGNLLELMDDRVGRNVLWSVDNLGNMKAANLPSRITVASTAPASPAAGDVWIDTSA